MTGGLSVGHVSTAGGAPGVRWPHVDGLRAVAVLAVMLFHLDPTVLRGGFLGVDVFFVISGFVVTAALAGHGNEPLGRFLAGFYHRRLTRILPALLVMLLLASVAWTLLIPRAWLSQQVESVGLAAFFGLSNWQLAGHSDTYFAPRAEFNVFTHTWSLGVEEQFYLVAPWFVYLAWRRTTGVALLAVLAAASAVWAAWATGRLPAQAFYGLVARWWELAAGSLWFLWAWHRPAPAWLQRVLPGLQPLGWVVLAASLLRGVGTGTPFPWAWGAVIGTLLLIGLPSTVGSVVVQPLCARVMQVVGLRSYSLYLWHWPVDVLMRWTVGLDGPGHGVAALAASFALAEVSYRWVERPLQRSARWNGLSPAVTCSLLVGAAVLAAAAASGAFAKRSAWSLSSVERRAVDWYANERDPTLVLPPGCVGDADVEAATVGGERVLRYRSCAGGVDKAERRLFLLGDSHATAYSPLAHRLSVEHRIAAVVVQLPGCPLLDMAGPLNSQQPAPGCGDRWQRVLAALGPDMRPGDVVLLASLRLPRFADQWGLYPHDDVISRHLSAATAAQRELAVQDADRWLQPLLQRGVQVVLEDPKPIFRAIAFRCADHWTSRNPVCARGLVETRADEEAFRAPVKQALRQAVARQPAAEGRLTIFDPLPALCDAASCRAIEPDGRPLFFDADHLSRWGNERVYPHFVRHLRQIGALPAQPGG